MADADRDDEPSLELPSFGFRRKKRKREAASATAEPEAAPQPAAQPPAQPPVEPAPAPEPEPQPQPKAAPEPEPQPRAASEPEPETQPQPEPEPTPEPAATQAPRTAPDPTPETAGQPLFVDEETATTTSVAADQERAEPEPAEPKPRKPLRVGIGAIPGAVLTGVLVGLVTVGLTWGSMRLCELVRGAPSCGGMGLFVLLLILVAMIFLGAALLRMFGVADPGSTSFLAVGLLTVVALLFLVDVLFSWWMIIVIPCVTLLTYTLSSWVTTSFVDPSSD